MKFSLLIDMKMPTIVGIFIFISRENVMPSWVEHEKSFITSGLVFEASISPTQKQVCNMMWLYRYPNILKWEYQYLACRVKISAVDVFIYLLLFFCFFFVFFFLFFFCFFFFIFFFIFSPRKIGYDISCKLSRWDNLHEKSMPIFWEKYEKYYQLVVCWICPETGKTQHKTTHHLYKILRCVSIIVRLQACEDIGIVVSPEKKTKKKQQQKKHIIHNTNIQSGFGV